MSCANPILTLQCREKKKSRSGALKVLSHAVNGVEGVDNCVKFVDILGLRSVGQDQEQHLELPPQDPLPSVHEDT